MRVSPLTPDHNSPRQHYGEHIQIVELAEPVVQAYRGALIKGGLSPSKAAYASDKIALTIASMLATDVMLPTHNPVEELAAAVPVGG